MPELAAPSSEALALIISSAPNGVCEIGAGEGHWLAAMRRLGVACVGYDIRPRGPMVEFGDHVAAAARHAELAFLAVWPPDGCAIEQWVRAWSGRTVIICGCWKRFRIGGALADFHRVVEVMLPPGRKGPSLLAIFQRTKE